MSWIRLQQGEFSLEVEDDRDIEGLVPVFDEILENHTNVLVADTPTKDVAVS